MGDELEKFSQADELIKAFHNMDNNELKFMFYALSQRQKGELEVKTTVYDILKKLHLDDGGEQIKRYQTAMKNIRKKSDMEVKMKADRLSDHDRELLNLSKDATVEIGGSLLSTVRDVKTNKVLIKFNKDFLPLLDDLKYNHTWIYIEQIAKLEGKYSPRFYEFCKMHLKNKTRVEFTWYLDNESPQAPGIRQFLNIGDKYEDWRNLKRRVIDPSVKEINEKCSDMFVSYEILKSKWVYALKLTLAVYDLNKVIDQDVVPGQISIFDVEMENPRSNRRGNKEFRLDQDTIKRVNNSLYNWLE